MNTPFDPDPASDGRATRESELDADVLAWLDQAVSPEPPDAAAAARVKKRLLRRIAADSTPRHATLAPAEGPWLPFGAGITMKVLHRDGDTLSYLLRLAPGAALPAHRHPQDEECLVLEGEMRIGELAIPAGGYHLGRKGVLHDRLTSPGGALIFLRGAVPEAAAVL
ncbi:MAG: cupin domain-containing protein [Rubrivivax sp.]|nr:cupin domain-containing protein [Rubrivivax sp.]